MKKIILAALALLSVFLLIVAVAPLRVLAKEPKDVKIDCPTISSTLPFEKSPESSRDYMGCNSYTGEDIAVSNTLVVLSGNISLDPLLGDANKSRSNSIPPSKIEALLVGDGGKIIYWGPPWGEGSHSQVEFRAKLGLCDMELTGYADGNITQLLKSGNYSPDWQAAADFMVEKLSKAAKEIEGQIGAECGAKNITGSKNNIQQTGQLVKPLGQKSQKDGSGTDFFQTISENFQDFYMTKTELIQADTDVLVNLDAREPRLTEENIKISQKEWKHTPTSDTGATTSPYRVDILNGAVQIKLPGQNEWSDLKQGDRIPPGSTIFTGMDTTTVLSIKDKGVIQVQSFTEITVTEKGLEEAAKTGQTYTDIELKKGEIEVNIEPYAPVGQPGSQGWGMSIYGAYYSAAVRGTHFWVRQEEGKKMATIGVYRGKVEVKTKSGKTIEVSPNGDKPGVVVVAQKLSVVKLILTGLVLIAVIAGSIIFIKRRRKKVYIQRK